MFWSIDFVNIEHTIDQIVVESGILNEIERRVCNDLILERKNIQSDQINEQSKVGWVIGTLSLSTEQEPIWKKS